MQWLFDPVVVVRDNRQRVLGRIPIADSDMLDQFGENYLVESHSAPGMVPNTQRGHEYQEHYRRSGYLEPYIRNFRVDNNAKPIDCTALVYWVPYVFDRSTIKVQPRSAFASEVWSMITNDFEAVPEAPHQSVKDTLSMLTKDSVLYLPRATVLGSCRGPQSDWMAAFLLNMHKQVLEPKLLGLQVPGATQNARLVSACRSILLKWYFGNINRDSEAKQRGSQASRSPSQLFAFHHGQNSRKIHQLMCSKQ